MTSAPGDAVLISFRVFMVIDTIYQLIVDYREGKIPILPLKIAIWDRFGNKLLLLLRSTFFAYWAENTQEKLQLSSKDKEEDMVAELGASNGSCTDSLRVLRRRL
ncbi:hypothetical protein Cadr_000011600 [Camelus dromedarius]|uniref:Uncharacterized protein n=1 Tax=Camelus dromedarius TaxID=9838 RepID=A0A5N4DVD7_CAMDR|nr:hypothetical protein Cadr_000011600 [Camelus dromedarius]